MKLRYIPPALVVGAVGAVVSGWPIYGDYWMTHGVSGVIRRDVIGHELGMLAAVALGLGYVALDHYSGDDNR